MHRLQLKTAYSPLQFAGIRILLGGYLLYYFLQLLPHRQELFSSLGMVPDVTVNTTYGISFWFISYFTSPGAISLLFVVLIVTSLLFTVGILRQVTALLLWVGWLILYNLNNLTIDPSLGFIGLLLLVFATVPNGEPLVLGKRFLLSTPAWRMPTITYWGIWFVFGLAFTMSGLEKFSSLIWTSGSAMGYFFSGPVGLSNQLVDWVITWPTFLHQPITWIVLYSQLLAVGMILFRKTRIILWFVLTGLFIGAIGFLDLFEVLLGMLIFYLFLVEATWFQPRGTVTVWIDETCKICQYFAKVIKNEDLKGKIVFYSYQDTTLQKYLSATEIEEMKEIIAHDGKRLYRGSDAVLRTCTQLGGLWTVVYIGYLCPRALRQYLYYKVSQNRYSAGICQGCSIKQ